MTGRETAWRVFARELEASLEPERGTGERATSYVLSPFGARMNRVLLAGTLSTAEPVGRDETPSFWRARLTDPTGAVAVTAGTFQPRAMEQLRAGSGSRTVLVVGKVNLYHGRDGTAYVSVRAESLRDVTETEERAHYTEALEQTLDRVDLVDRLARGEAAAPREVGFVPPPWVVAAAESLRRYPSADRLQFRRDLRPVLGRIVGVASSALVPPAPPSVQVRRDPAPSPSTAPTAAERAEESLLLEFLDQVAEASLDAYADRRELLARVGAQGLGTDRAEAVLTRLEDEGVVEEPVVGKLRRA